MMRAYYGYDQTGYSQSGEPDYRFGSKLTPAIRWIIFICIIVFILQVALSRRSPTGYDGFMHLFAFNPRLAVGAFRIWQFITHMFLHGSICHIAVNLITLWMIGGLVESRLGTRRFLVLYFLAGIAGAALQGIIDPDIPCIGASGGIMGVAAACAMLYPDLIILALFIIPMKMKHFVWVLVVLQLLGAASATQGPGIAYFAHLAGLGAGYLFVKFHMRTGGWLNNLLYRLRRPFRGLGGQGKATHIDNDQEYREEVDRLLDKIFKEGSQSLSKEESEFLRRQSEKYRRES